MTFLRDLKHSLRALLKTPAFTVTAVVSLAIGLGAATTVFTFVNAFFLRPLPGVDAQGRLVNVHQSVALGERARRFSKPSYDDLRDSSRGFAELAAFTDRGFNLTAGGETGLVIGQVVSGNYFSVLGVEPAAGRLLRPADDGAPGASPVAVLSHRLWQRRFGGDPGVVGSTIELNGVPYAVVGVAAEGFIGTFIGFASELFVPLAMAEVAVPGVDLADRGADLVEVFGRIADGVTLDRAEAGLAVAARGLGREYFPDQPDYSLRATPVTGFDDSIRAPIAALVAVLLAVAALVLAIAGVNVANMLLVRAAGRRREIAVRLALGAPRHRLAGLLLAESLLLAAGGGALGLLIAVWATDALRAFDPTITTAASLVLDFRLDARVLLFALAATLATGALFGLAPALQSSRGDLTPALRQTGDSADRSRLRSVFVAGQVALTLLLLLGAGLFLRVLTRVASIDPGFEIERVLAAPVDTSLLGLDGDAERADFYRRLLARLGEVPGIEAVSLTRSLPLTFGRRRTGIEVEGHPPPAGEDAFEVDFTAIAPGYFDALAIPLLRGRDVDARDSTDAPRVAVVNQALARRFWPGEEAVGRRFTRDGESVMVVGVARDSKVNNLSEEPTPCLYLPFDQAPSHRVSLVARVAGDGPLGGPASALRAALHDFDGELPIVGVMPLSRLTGLSLLPQRVAATVAGVLAAIALLLAVFGVYGAVATSVQQRRRELGIRVSLGARRADVVRLVVGQGLRLIAAGVAVGLPLSALATRLLGGFLVGVSPTDPATFAAAVALLAAATVAASYFPARRAARMDPVRSLRTE